MRVSATETYFLCEIYVVLQEVVVGKVVVVGMIVQNYDFVSMEYSFERFF